MLALLLGWEVALTAPHPPTAPRRHSNNNLSRRQRCPACDETTLGNESATSPPLATSHLWSTAGGRIIPYFLSLVESPVDELPNDVGDAAQRSRLILPRLLY